VGDRARKAAHWERYNKRCRVYQFDPLASQRQRDFIRKLRFERGAAGMALKMPSQMTSVQANTLIQELKKLPVKTSYIEYLESANWKKLREKVLERDGHRCAKCGKPDRLQAHHRTYDRVREENLDDLITLCRTCHAAVHGKIQV
jgi:5-methylcytosine-specific restriction endonuclease McrA